MRGAASEADGRIGQDSWHALFMHDTATDGDVSTEHTPGPSFWRQVTPGRIVLAAVVLASFAVWAYAFSGFAGREAPDTIRHPSYGALAEPTCAAAMTELESVPNALDAQSPAERASQIAEADVILATMVNDLEAHLDDPSVTIDDRDRNITTEWLADWRRFIADREDFRLRLADDPQAVFYVAAVGGERLERRITRFANTNLLLSCVTPSDVG